MRSSAPAIAVCALILLSTSQPSRAQALLYNETFNTSLGTMTPSDRCNGAAEFYFETACPSSGLPGHSAPGHARWGVLGDCTSYGAITQDRLRTPAINISGCSSAITLDFNYLLNYQETANDRARVEVSVDGAAFVVVADTGVAGGGLCTAPGSSGIGGLTNNGGWLHKTINLDPIALGGLSLRVQFSADTFDGASDAGEGFFVDDVSVTCLAPGCPIITVSPSTLPNGTMGTAYNQTITASGGVAPYQFVVTAGALPTGLNLNPFTGVILGTPTTQGTFNFTVRAIDVNGCTGSRNYTLTIVCPGLALYCEQFILDLGNTGNTDFCNGQADFYQERACPSSNLPGHSAPGHARWGEFGNCARYGTDFTEDRLRTPTVNVAGCTGSIVLSFNYLLDFQEGSMFDRARVEVAANGGFPIDVADNGPGGPVCSGGGGSGGVGGLANKAGWQTAYIGISATSTVRVSFIGETQDGIANNGEGFYVDDVTIQCCPTITLSPGTLPNGVEGIPYSQTITASGGTAPYTFVVSSGALPAGLTLSSGGVLSGTPTLPGAFNFSVRATDANGCVGTLPYTLVITCPVITLSPATLPNGNIGIPYNQTITASGGTSPYAFGITAGALPPGLALTSGGVLSGTPTTIGTYSFTVTVTDTNGCTGAQNYTVVIGCPVITLSPTTLPTGTVGVPYSQTITASGGTAPYSFAVTAGALPAGLTLTAAGVLSGTPTTPGSFNFTVTATDANACSGTQSYTLVISCPVITVSPTTLPNGTVGVPYSQTITASGGTAPYSFAVTAGALPAGLTLTAAGVLSGTPTAPGSFNFTVTATDTNACTGTRAYTLVISCPVITLSPSSLPNGTVGTTYSQTITASGGAAPYTFSVTAGTLPSGLSLSTGGALSGTPTAAGTFTFTVTAVDANGCSGSKAYTLTICGVITLSPSTLPDGIVTATYSQSLTASGGTSPYVLTISAGALPTGLSLSPGGIISGTPSARGRFTFTVTATDAIGCTGSRGYTLVIHQIVNYLVGEGLGFPNRNGVKIFTQAGTATAVNFLAYGAGQFGTNVASGDIDGGAYGEILTGPGPGTVYGPQVRAFRQDATAIAKVNFYAYGTLKYGVNVSTGNVDGDAFDEILTGPGPGVVFGPQVRGWNFDGTALASINKINYNAYGAPLQYGVNVTAGDVDGDGYEEIVTGKGPSTTFVSEVRGFNYDNTAIVAMAAIDFNAFTLVGYGVNVAVGDVDGDGYAEIACTPGPGPTHPSQFVGFNFDNATITPLAGFNVTPFTTTLYGGRVGLGDVNKDLRRELLTGAGRDSAADSTVKGYAYSGGSLTQVTGQFVAFPGDTYGVNVTGGEFGY